MAQLQQPLKGMATGFSSSLFGLFTSLSLGLIARFSNTASLAFKDSFESWLASVSQEEARDAHVNAAPASAEALAAGSMSGISQSFERLHRDIASSSTESAEFIKGQMRQTGYLQRGVRHLQSLVDGQINLDRKLAGTLNRMTDALCQFEEHGRMHNQTLIEHNAQTAERLENAINRLVASLDAIAASQNRARKPGATRSRGFRKRCANPCTR